MQRAIIIVLVALTAVVALAEGQYYVPRAYYTIDTEGHASAPVPLRRLRRSYNPVPLPYGGGGGDATANANAWAQGGGDATANANARTGYGWGPPPRGAYGSALRH